MGYALTITYFGKSDYSTWNKSFLKVWFKAWIESFKPKTFSIDIQRTSQYNYIFEKEK